MIAQPAGGWLVYIAQFRRFRQRVADFSVPERHFFIPV
jgi:hypothetical protein